MDGEDPATLVQILVTGTNFDSNLVVDLQDLVDSQPESPGISPTGRGELPPDSWRGVKRKTKTHLLQVIEGAER